MNSSLQYLSFKKLLLPFCLMACSIVLYIPTFAQEHPPKPILVSVSTLQHLSFGTFIQSGASGTVTVDYTGSRTATGSIILPGMFSIVTPALFQVSALPGTLITIVNGTTATLTGSNGGSITLELEQSSTGSPFITNGTSTDVFIGGKLTIGPLAANPAGLYNGTFTVTFIQQ